MTQDEKADVLQSSLNMIEKIDMMYAVTPDSYNHETSDSKKALTKTIGRVKSNFYTNLYPNWAYFSKNSFAGSLAVLALLIGTGGVSLAAESSLPGDVLYTVKVNINESAKSLIAITPEAKAKFALEIADKRLKEVALLSQKGRLNNQTGLILTKQLAKQADQVKFQVASLVSTNDLKSAQEIALNFESSMRAHELILEKISTEHASSTGTYNTEKLAQLDSLISKLKSEIATTTIARNTIQSKEVASVLGSEDREKLELRISQVRAKLADLTTQVSSSTLSESSASTTRGYISEANRLARFATDKLRKSLFQESLILVQSAFQYANDAEVVLATNLAGTEALKSVTADALSNITMSLSTLSTSSSEVIMSATIADILASSSTASSTDTTSTSTDSAATSTNPEVSI